MSTKYKVGDRFWAEVIVNGEVDYEGDIPVIIDGRSVWVAVDTLRPQSTAQPPGESQGLKAIPNDKMHVACLGHEAEFVIESLFWEGIGPMGDPSLTVRGRGPRGTRLEAQLLAPYTVPRWVVEGVQGPKENKS